MAVHLSLERDETFGCAHLVSAARNITSLGTVETSTAIEKTKKITNKHAAGKLLRYNAMRILGLLKIPQRGILIGELFALRLRYFHLELS